MEIKQESRDEVLILKPTGRIDQNSADTFQASLLKALADSAGGVVIDMAGVDFISSVGLRALMVAARKAKADNVGLTIAGLTPTVKEVFTISRFTTVIACFDDVEAARAKLKS